MRVRTLALLSALVLVGGFLILWTARGPEVARATVPDPGARPPEQGIPGRLEGLAVEDPSSGSRTAVETALEEPEASAPAVASSTTIRGRFVDAAGLSIGGVEVSSAELAASGRSDGQGRFELSFDLERAETSCTLHARMAGFVPAHRTVQLGGEPVVWLGDWKLEGGAPVSGTVRDSIGLGVAEVSVGCLREDVPDAALANLPERPLEEVGTPEPRCVTGADGTFLLDGVPFGERRLVAAAEGWQTAVSSRFDLRANVPADPIDIRLVARGGPGVLAGVVLSPRGEGVPRARLGLRSSSGSRVLFTDEGGRFRATGVPSQPQQEIVASDPAGRWGEARMSGVRPGSLDLVLHLVESERFRLVVSGDDGSAVEEFAVTLLSQDGAALQRLELERHAGGEVELVRPSATFQLRLEAPGWMPWVSEWLAPAGVSPRWIVQLAPARGVAGTVLFDGAPLPKARVSIHEAFAELALVNGLPVRSDPSALASASSGPDGSYRIGVPTAGLYYLRVEADGWASAERGPLSLGPATAERVDVTLGRGGAIEVGLRSWQAELAGRVVRISRGDGFPRTRRTDPSGILLFEELMPGPWLVELAEVEWDDSSWILRRTSRPLDELQSNVRVVEGGRERIELWLDGPERASPVLSGFLGIDGRGAQGWRARLEDDAGFSDEVPVDARGAFELSVPSMGTFQLTLTKSPGEALPMQVLRDTVALESPRNSWSFSFETAALAGEVPAELRAAAGTLFHVWSSGTVTCWSPLLPDAAGFLATEGLPAGMGRIVRVELDRPLDARALETGLAVELPPGARTELVWPR